MTAFDYKRLSSKKEKYMFDATRQVTLRIPEIQYGKISQIKSQEQRNLSNTLLYLLGLGIERYKEIKKLEREL
jgi:hypothetical protein